MEGGRSQETPTCGAVGAHSADRKEDFGVAVEHLQGSPAVHLGEVGVPIQRPKMREYSVTDRTASEGSDHHKHLPGLPQVPSWEPTRP